jgi:transcriptional regulator NrdR family protein
MTCPHCGHGYVKNIDSRKSPNNTRRRRYECHQCKRRWSTTEAIGDAPVMAVAVALSQIGQLRTALDRLERALKGLGE